MPEETFVITLVQLINTFIQTELVHHLVVEISLQELKPTEITVITLVQLLSSYFTLVYVSTVAPHLMLSIFTVEISSVIFLASQVFTG